MRCITVMPSACSFDDYTRRWQVMAGHDGRPMQPFPEWAVQQLGFDVEHEVYEMVGGWRQGYHCCHAMPCR